MFRISIFIIIIFNAIPLVAENPYASFNLNSNLSFEENKGQVKGINQSDQPNIKYVLRVNGMSIFIRTDGLTYQYERILYPSEFEDILKNDTLYKSIKKETHRVDMTFLNSNPKPTINAKGKSEDYTNYYNHGVLDVHTYTSVEIHDIYPNIDWVIYIKDQQLKYDFIVHPNGNYQDIHLQYDYADSLYLDQNGNLIISTHLGIIQEQKPDVFQNNKTLLSKYKLENNQLKYIIENYNSEFKMFIDPQIAWGTYYGTLASMGLTNIVDKNLNVYLSGNTNALSGIANGGFQITLGGDVDCYLVKFNKQGVRLWSSYYGGMYQDVCLIQKSLSIDKSNNIYLCGHTQSSNNIAYNGFKNTLTSGKQNTFLVKFNSAGTRLWATYYGGDSSTNYSTCITDQNNNVYLAGSTLDTGLSYNGFKNKLDSSDCFLVKFDSSGNRLWATYYGGKNNEDAKSLAVDYLNNIYLTGTTSSNQDISYNGFQNTYGGNKDDFMVKFNSAGTRLWATYIGGNGIEGNSYLTIKNDLLYLSGISNSNTNISFNGFQDTIGGMNDSYLILFDTLGNRKWGTYYGGNNNERPIISNYVDKKGFIYISGSTLSTNKIAYKGIKNSMSTGGLYDIYIAKFSPSGARIWGTYYGGSGNDYSNGLSGDSTLNIYFSGYTNSTSGISYNGFQNTYGSGNSNAFLVKITCTDTTNLFDTICSTRSYVFNNQIITQSGIYRDTLENWEGCDSFLILHLMIKNADTTTLDSSICQGTQVWFNQALRDTTGIYRDTLTNRNGCDSLILLRLTVNKKDTTYLSHTVCGTSAYSFNNFINLQTTGTYYDTFQNQNHCDSFIVLNFTRNPIDTTYILKTLCQHTPYTFNGENLTQSGLYRDTLQNQYGCDSTIILSLSIHKPDTTRQQVLLCRGTNYLFYTQSLSQAGTYTHTFTNQYGCDSVIELTLIYLQPYVQSLDTILCYGATYKNYTQSGSYIERYTATNGCDSTINIKITYSDPPRRDSSIYHACHALTINNKTYNQSQSFTETIKTSHSCDSIYRYYELHIHSNRAVNLPDTTLHFCDSLSFHNNTYSQTTEIIDTLKKYEMPYCDSAIRKIQFLKEERAIAHIITNPTDTLVRGQIIYLSSTPYRNYLWSTGEQTQILKKSLYTDTTIGLKVWDYTGCEDTTSIRIYTKPKSEIGIPNAFSPNGDGVNDYFEINNLNSDYQILEGKIYNRWGEKVYQSTPTTFRWNGYYHNELCPTGTYTYILLIKYLPLQTITEYKGTINIMY